MAPPGRPQQTPCFSPGGIRVSSGFSEHQAAGKGKMGGGRDGKFDVSQNEQPPLDLKFSVSCPV